MSRCREITSGVSRRLGSYARRLLLLCNAGCPSTSCICAMNLHIVMLKQVLRAGSIAMTITAREPSMDVGRSVVNRRSAPGPAAPPRLSISMRHGRQLFCASMSEHSHPSSQLICARGGTTLDKHNKPPPCHPKLVAMCSRHNSLKSNVGRQHRTQHSSKLRPSSSTMTTRDRHHDRERVVHHKYGLTSDGHSPPRREEQHNDYLR
jgi:hypothetical protein